MRARGTGGAVRKKRFFLWNTTRLLHIKCIPINGSVLLAFGDMNRILTPVNNRLYVTMIGFMYDNRKESCPL